MTNYSRGADFERAVKAKLEDEGFYVVRSAGSHGLVDLIAIPEPLGPFDYCRPQFIQVKINGKIKPAERLALVELSRRYAIEPMKAWRPKRGEIRIEDIRW